MKWWLNFKNNKDIGTLFLILGTLIGFAGMTMTIFFLFKLSYSSSSLKSDQLYNVMTIFYMLLMTFFLSTVAFFWGFKNWLLPLTLKITNMANFHRRLMNFSPVLKLVKHLQMLQVFVKYYSLVMYHKMSYINQFTASLLTCLLMLIIQCLLMKYGVESFGAVAYCYTPDTSINIPEISSQVSVITNTPPALSNSVEDPVHEILLNLGTLPPQSNFSSETSLWSLFNGIEEFLFGSVQNLDELDNLVPFVDGAMPNGVEEPLYLSMLDLPSLADSTEEPIYVDFLNLGTLPPQSNFSSETSLWSLFNGIEEFLFGSVQNLDELDNLVPFVDGAMPNGVEEPLYLSIPDLSTPPPSNFSSEAPASLMVNSAEEPVYNSVPNLDGLDTLVPFVDGTMPNSVEEPLYLSIPDLGTTPSSNFSSEATLSYLVDCVEEPGYKIIKNVSKPAPEITTSNEMFYVTMLRQLERFSFPSFTSVFSSFTNSSWITWSKP